METDSITHIVYCPFTGLGDFGGYRGNKWLKNRVKIFKEYTLNSLLCQKSMRYVLWCSFRPEDENNPIVMEFEKGLEKLRELTSVFTFGGVCFYDDKVKDGKEKLIENLTRTLPKLEQHITGNWVYMTIQPSDDMYLSYVFDEIQKLSPKEGAIGFTKGYIMDYNTQQIAEYNPLTIPPFFTIMFPREIFLDPMKHFYYTGPYKSHEDIRDKLKFEELPGREFVVGTHGENISTFFQHPYSGRLLDDWEEDGVRILTGTLTSLPLNIKKPLKRFSKYIPGFIRNLYYDIRLWKEKTL